LSANKKGRVFYREPLYNDVNLRLRQGPHGTGGPLL
jgi:hypothetical protein